MKTSADLPPLPLSAGIDELSERFKIWLDNNETDFAKFRSWLIGYEMPALGRERQPYSLMFECLNFLDSSYNEKLAQKIADFLMNVSPKEYLSKTYNDKFLYNVFYLCAVLNNKKVLAQPLREKYIYFKEKSKDRSRIFSQKLNYDVTDAFREALMANQTDETYCEVWKNIFEENESEFLFTYSILYGYRGINNMSSNENSTLPNFDAIGWALKQMTNYLENEKERGQKFRGLTERTQDVWSDYPNWNETFHCLSNKYQWQDWATVKLDSLVQPLDEYTDGLQHFLVWDLYLPFLEKLNLIDENQKEKYGKIMYKIKASKRTVCFLIGQSEEIKEAEEARLNCPFREYIEIRKASNEPFNRSKNLSVNIARVGNIASNQPTSQQKIKVKNVLSKAVGSIYPSSYP